MYLFFNHVTISTIQKLYKKGLRQTRDNVSFRWATRSLARPSVSVKCLQSSRARRGTLAWRGREASGGGVRQGTKARSSRRGAEGGRRSRRGAVGVRAEKGNTGYRTNEKGSREPEGRRGGRDGHGSRRDLPDKSNVFKGKRSRRVV